MRKRRKIKRLRKKTKVSFVFLLIRLIKYSITGFKALLWFLFTLGKVFFWVSQKIFDKLRKRNKLERTKQLKKLKKRFNKPVEYKGFRELKKIKGNLINFERKLYSRNIIGIILGARGKGKTALGMRLLENFKTKSEKEIYAFGFRREDLPLWIKVTRNLEEIKNNSVVLIDEGGLEFSSRRAMSSANKLLSDLLLISRHKDLSILFIAQSSANLEINVLRQADFLILKPSSLLQLDFERKKIQEIYKETKKYFEKFKKEKGLSYLYSEEYCGFVCSDLPSFWGEEISKAYQTRISNPS